MRILLVGCSGVGKSTVASLLLNGTALKGLNEHDIFVTSSATPGTLNAIEYSNNKYVLVDTIGIGSDVSAENPLGTAEALVNLKNFLKQSRKGYHFIFLVVKGNRRAAYMLRAYNMFFKGLFPEMYSRFALVATQYVYATHIFIFPLTTGIY